ncbi:MAG: DUF1761 domain-containing protein, partial [Bdellovibrionota bacterium]
MTSAMSSLNWYAVFLATVIYFVLGGIWFTPLFGKSWDQAIGFKRPASWKPGLALYLAPLLSSFTGTVATAILARATGATTASDGILLGILLAIGYSAAVAGVDAVSPQNRRPLKLFLLTGSYHFVSL